MPAHVFREYDIRGVADRDLTNDVVSGIGCGLAHMLAPDGRRPRIVVGRDCRLSAPRLFDALLSGLVEGGSDVTDIGVGPTPLTYFGVHHLDADGGVMITGSHNPKDDNGFKIMRGTASFFGEHLQRLHDLIRDGIPEPTEPGSIQSVPLEDDYIHALRERIDVEDSAMKIVVDAGNGAAGPLGLRALRAAGLDPVALFCEMDGSFPNHHPDPTVVENLRALVEAVRANEAAVGIAWDGDGDRMGVVDDRGEMVFGDRLLALFARDVLRNRPGSTVIGDVKCSQSTFDDIEAHGGKAIMWRTGHALIKTKMKAEQALLAGEMSGHFFFADRYFGFDDGIYAALRLVEILARERRPLGELLADLPVGFATPELRVDCPDDQKFDVVESVRDAFRGKEKMSEVDGARIIYDDGAWALVRASNTGPVIVLRFEAPTEERLAEIRRDVEQALGEARSRA